MAGLAYLAVPTVLVGLAVPVVAIVTWRAGQRLAGYCLDVIMRRAMDADAALVSE